jgi:hypothetical protein
LEQVHALTGKCENTSVKGFQTLTSKQQKSPAGSRQGFLNSKYENENKLINVVMV